MRGKCENIKEVININNNPIFFTGRIERKIYFITKSILYAILTIILLFVKQSNIEIATTISGAVLTQIIFILSFFAASKRLRDIKWSQWLLLIWLIPIFGGIIGLPLLFVKSKFSNNVIDNTI